MTSGKIQTKHIPDKALIDLVDRLWNIPRISITLYGQPEVRYSNGAHLNVICKVWDNIPPKVILNKLKKLEERGLIAEGGTNSYTVVHESDLPVYRWFSPYTESWQERPMSHREYRAYRH